MLTTLKTIDEALPRFQRADLLLARATNWPGRCISIASLSEYSHAAMLARRNKEWVVLDVVQWRGGTSRPLRLAVRQNPQVWDHYRVNTDRFPEFDREAAELRMWEFDGIKYGWWELVKASVIFLPGIRLFQKVAKLAIDDESSNTTPPFCSMAYSIASTAGGVDPVKKLRHSMTMPGHLAQSHLFDYQCTLVPDSSWREQLPCTIQQPSIDRPRGASSPSSTKEQS